MSDGSLGVSEAVSIALGGMIGGGIYAVLGVVTEIAGGATWVAFGLAGVTAGCSAYSYVGLNALAVDEGHDGGGSVTFVQAFTGNSTLAGVVGWTLLVGYVGSMAMYAFAFGEFTVVLPVVPESVSGVPLRPLVSVIAVAGFVGLNMLGAQATGTTENILVAAKILVLVAFGGGGIAYAVFASPQPVDLGIAQVASVNPIIAAAIAFVAFQGWQLLFYDQESLDRPRELLPKAIAIAIPVAVVLYAIVAVATFNLAPEALQHNPHTALSNAAATVAGVVGLATAGSIVISLSALFSTGSAINATLFSAGHFAKGLLSNDLLPDQVGDSSASGVPTRTLVLLGVLTSILTAYGSLSAITAFASLAFIVVFGGACALAFAHRDADHLTGSWPAIGAVGGGLFAVLMLYHLFVAERGTFYTVVVIAVVVLAVELLYFERSVVEAEIQSFGTDEEDASE